jgi:choline dehydrogenase-like flavoprotein
MTESKVSYKASDEVDFVIIGSGAAGGVLAKELSTNGFRVVVLEQGPYLTPNDFTHDELKIFNQHFLTNNPTTQPNTFRAAADKKAVQQQAVMYGHCVGGSSVHFTANFWRFHEVDFKERSKIGEIPGTGFADWPISYADLEPYYTKVEWEVGVSGLAGASPFDPPRSKPYPMPPLPVKGSGVIFEQAAKTWLPSVSFTDGDSFAATCRAICLCGVRFLSGIRLRSRREVFLARVRDSRSGKDRAM